jgi:hypothetical protein
MSSAGGMSGGSVPGATAAPGSVGTPAIGGGSGTVGSTTPAPGVTGTTSSGVATTGAADANGNQYRSITGSSPNRRPCGLGTAGSSATTGGSSGQGSAGTGVGVNGTGVGTSGSTGC